MLGLRGGPPGPEAALLSPLLTAGEAHPEALLQLPGGAVTDRGHTSTVPNGGAVRKAIHALKYQGVRAVAPTLGQLLVPFLAQEGLEGDLLVPVPLHPKRERQRGYNQSLLLAQAVGRATGLAVEPRALTRVTSVPSQVSLRAEERCANVAEAFRARPESVVGRRILVIDDVCTTGATLEACALALKEAGAVSVWGLALAREA